MMVIGLTQRERKLHSDAMATLANKLTDLSRSLLEPEQDAMTVANLFMVAMSSSRVGELLAAVTEASAESNVPDSPETT